MRRLRVLGALVAASVPESAEADSWHGFALRSFVGPLANVNRDHRVERCVGFGDTTGPGSPSSGEEPPKNARSTGSRCVSGPLARAKARMNAGLFGSYTEIGANS